MKLTHLFVAAMALSLAAAAHAGTIILSGDTNIANVLDGSGGATPGDDAQFFKNALGSGTQVFQFNSTLLNSSVVAAQSAISVFYAALPGVTVTKASGSFSAANLAGVNLFVGVLPDANFTPAETSALATFLSGGGTAFFLGENNNSLFTTSNAAINAALTTLGSTMQIVPASIDAGFQTVSGSAHIIADPLTVGVNQFTYALTSQVSGGKSLFLDSTGPFIAEQSVSPATPVPLPASLWSGLTVLGGMALLTLRRRKLSH
jgi:hypothetical protein